MGLPLFVTPVEPEIPSKTTKVPRSAIRRPTGRHARLPAETRRRRLLGAASNLFPDDFEVQIVEPSSRDSHQTTGSASSVAPNTTRRLYEQERMRLRDPLSFERQRAHDHDDGPLMPPVPESRDFTGMDELQRRATRSFRAHSQLRRLPRRYPEVPTHIDADTRPRSRLRSPIPSRTPPLSPSYEPSRPSSITSPVRQFFDDSSRTIQASSVAPTLPQPSLSDRIHALSRATEDFGRSRAILRQARWDGLGDRDRSLSPEGGGVWDTLLTSITPDPQPPSAGSSFASASASAAAVSTASPGHMSAGTSMTSLGMAEDSATVPDCDLSDSGTNSEDDEELMDELSELRNGRIDGDQWRSYADVATSHPDLSGRSGRTSDSEHLGGMHRIISRLSERDDIPDSWWASAGLSRNLRREPAS